MAKTFNFPVWLRGTPEQQKAEEEHQALLRASFTRAKMSESERLIGRGALLEQTARGNLALADTEESKTLASSQLADSLAMQGKYSEAAETHPDPVRKEHFEKIIAAIELPDGEKCGCLDSTAKINDVDLSITPRFERDRIYSPVHKGVVSLVECSKCGHQNARPLRSRLLRHNAAINQNEKVAAAGEKAGRGLLSDAQVLSGN